MYSSSCHFELPAHREHVSGEVLMLFQRPVITLPGHAQATFLEIIFFQGLDMEDHLI
jgi:hypothetical protein